MVQPAIKPTIAERFIIGFIVLLLVEIGQFAFSLAAQLIAIAGLGLLFAISSRSLVAKKVLLLVALASGALATFELRDARPLSLPVAPQDFEQRPLVEVFEAIARSNTNRISTMFWVFDEKLPEKTLTLSIPEGATLGEVLEQISEKVGCDFKQGWVKLCGNAGRPTTVRFAVIPKKAPFPERNRVQVIISRFGTTRPPKSDL